jgi:hypothetical protein
MGIGVGWLWVSGGVIRFLGVNGVRMLGVLVIFWLVFFLVVLTKTPHYWLFFIYYRYYH